MNEILMKAYEEHIDALQDYLNAEKELIQQGDVSLSQETLYNVLNTKVIWQKKHNDFYTLLTNEDLHK